MRRHFIINMKPRRNPYVDTSTEAFDGDWAKNYSHLEKEDTYLWTHAACIYEDQKTPQGFYFEYDLVRDGARFQIYVPYGTDKEMEKQAKQWLRNNRDVVNLKIIRIQKVK